MEGAGKEAEGGGNTGEGGGGREVQGQEGTIAAWTIAGATTRSNSPECLVGEGFVASSSGFRARAKIPGNPCGKQRSWSWIDTASPIRAATSSSE